jgi:branched-chain amino acid transport system substrate-binding protein
MLKRIIYHRVVLAGLMVVLTCFGRGAEPLKIGMIAPVTGPLAERGLEYIQGAKLASEEINKTGGVLGRPIELVIEDDQTTNPGSVLAFSKLAGDKDIPGFIGPILSTQVHAMAPAALKTEAALQRQIETNTQIAINQEARAGRLEIAQAVRGWR